MKMRFGRKLLYHRGIDDSAGNYVTNYLLFVECFAFGIYFVHLFVKHRGSPKENNGFAKSTYAITGLFALIGAASLVAGLTHQFLQTIEPYDDFHDSNGWLVAWRLAAALSGAMSFVFLLLTEHLLTSEKVLKVNRVVFIIYYLVATLVCIGIAAHSFWLLSVEDNPWTLTLTFALVSATSFIELMAISVVLWKRFRSTGTNAPISHNTVALNTDSTEKCNSHAERKREENVFNNNATQRNSRRTDLLLHFFAPSIFLLAGVFQILMGSVGKCSQHRIPNTTGCPLPDEFNHNTVFHLLQIVSMAAFFAAELCAIKHRKQKLIFKKKSSEENTIRLPIDT